MNNNNILLNILIEDIDLFGSSIDESFRNYLKDMLIAKFDQLERHQKEIEELLRSSKKEE